MTRASDEDVDALARWLHQSALWADERRAQPWPGDLPAVRQSRYRKVARLLLEKPPPVLSRRPS